MRQNCHYFRVISIVDLCYIQIAHITFPASILVGKLYFSWHAKLAYDWDERSCLLVLFIYKKHWNILTFRDEVSRGAQKDQIIKQTSFERKKEIQNLNYNDQILVVNSATLGQTAKDNNSFTQGLLRLEINQRLHKTGFRCVISCLVHGVCLLFSPFSVPKWKKNRSGSEELFYIENLLKMQLWMVVTCFSFRYWKPEETALSKHPVYQLKNLIFR